MPLSQYSIVFICFTFLTLQQLATGLICYDCELCSTVDSNTATTYVVDGAGYSCYKIIATIAGVSGVNRGATTNCQQGSGSIGGVSGSIFCCTSDRCNTAMALSTSFGLPIVTATIVIILRAMIIG